MKWLLLLTVLSGYSGSSTVAANFSSKQTCEAAAKAHVQALKDLRWQNQGPDIIGNAAQSPLRLASLGILVLGALGFLLLRDAAGKLKLLASR
jgi:hypothetical protein